MAGHAREEALLDAKAKDLWLPGATQHGYSTQRIRLEGRDLGEVLRLFGATLATLPWRAAGLQLRRLQQESCRPASLAQASGALAAADERQVGFCERHAAWAQEQEAPACRESRGGARLGEAGRHLDGLGEAWESACARDEGWGERLTRAALLVMRADSGGCNIIANASILAHASTAGKRDTEGAEVASWQEASCVSATPTWLDKVLKAGLLASICRAWYPSLSLSHHLARARFQTLPASQLAPNIIKRFNCHRL